MDKGYYLFEEMLKYYGDKEKGTFKNKQSVLI